MIKLSKKYRGKLRSIHVRVLQCLLAVSVFGLPCFLYAHEGEENVLEEVVVKGRKLNLAGEARSASEGVIGQEDLQLRPLLRPGDEIPGAHLFYGY